MDHSTAHIHFCSKCKARALPTREDSAKVVCRSRHTFASEPSKLGYINGHIHKNIVSQILLGSKSLDDDSDEEGSECPESESNFTEARSLHSLLAILQHALLLQTYKDCKHSLKDEAVDADAGGWTDCTHILNSFRQFSNESQTI